jgi:hypothetical protein
VIFWNQITLCSNNQNVVLLSVLLSEHRELRKKWDIQTTASSTAFATVTSRFFRNVLRKVPNSEVAEVARMTRRSMRSSAEGIKSGHQLTLTPLLTSHGKIQKTTFGTRVGGGRKLHTFGGPKLHTR